MFTGFNLGGEDVYITDLLSETPNLLITNWQQFMVPKYVLAGRATRVMVDTDGADMADSDTTWTIDQYNSSVYKMADAVDPGNANVRRRRPAPLLHRCTIIHSYTHLCRRSTRT